MDKKKTMVLVGNPNTGKSTIFNALTGMQVSLLTIKTKKLRRMQAVNLNIRI